MRAEMHRQDPGALPGSSTVWAAPRALPFRQPRAGQVPAARTGLAAAPFQRGRAAGAGRRWAALPFPVLPAALARPRPRARCQGLPPARVGSGLRVWSRAAACTPNPGICQLLPRLWAARGLLREFVLVLWGIHGGGEGSPKCCQPAGEGKSHLNTGAATAPDAACCCLLLPGEAHARAAGRVEALHSPGGDLQPGFACRQSQCSPLPPPHDGLVSPPLKPPSEAGPALGPRRTGTNLIRGSKSRLVLADGCQG